MISTRFTHLALENWRNFRVVDVDLAPRVFVAGPNASGKTNFLDAFRFLHDIAQTEGSVARAVSVRGGFSRIRSLHAHGPKQRVRVQVALVIKNGTWEYELVLDATKASPPRVFRERVAQNGIEVLLRPNERDLKDPRLCEQTHLEQLSQNGAFRDLVEALASVQHVHVVPQVAKASIGLDGALLREAPGSDFIEQIARLNKRRQKSMVAQIGKLLKVAVPKFSELKVTRDKVGRPHIEALYSHWRPGGAHQREADFSDGTLRLLGFLFAMLNGTAPLIVEEPELSLHREVVRQIPRLMAAASVARARQVMISTHAEEALSDTGIDPAEILILTPTDDETLVEVGSSDRYLVESARKRVPLGPLVVARTRPTDIEQLSLRFEGR